MAEGDVVAVVESMKMETSLTAPFAGRVRRVLAGTNVQVPAQTPLLQLEPIEGEAAEQPATASAFASPTPSGERGLPRAARAPALAAARLRRQRRRGRRIVADLTRRAPTADATPRSSPASTGCCDVFADVRALTRARHDEATRAQLLHSPQEYLHALLRSLDAKAERLPERFMALLARALAHYGIDDLDRTPALEEACYRLFVCPGARADLARAAVMAILERRLQQRRRARRAPRRRLPRERSTGSGGHRAAATRSSPTWPARCATATSTARDRRAPGRARLRRDGRSTSPRSRRTRRARTATSASRRSSACPRCSPRCSSRACATAEPALQRLLVEATARRYYRVRALEDFEPRASPATTCCWPSIPSRAAAATWRRPMSTSADVGAVASAFARHAATLPDDDLAVLDLYAEHAAAAPPARSWPRRCARRSRGVALPAALHRIVVAVARPERGRGMSAIDTFTFRHQPEGLVEDEVLRGLHPMMGQRLDLWRMDEFALERMASPRTSTSSAAWRTPIPRTSGCSLWPRCAT